MLCLAHSHITAHADSIDAQNRPAWPGKTSVTHTPSICWTASLPLIFLITSGQYCYLFDDCAKRGGGLTSSGGALEWFQSL